MTTPDGVPLAVREVGPRECPADGRVRARLLSSHGRLPLSARQTHRTVGRAGPHGVLRPAWPRPVRGRAAGVVHRRATRPGPRDRVGGHGAARPGGARRTLHGRHDGAVARPPVPAALSHPHRRRRVDRHGGRGSGAVTAGRDPEEPRAGGGPFRCAVRAEDGAPHQGSGAFDHRAGAARGVLRRREDQPQRGRVLRADDARHARRHARRIPARARSARRDCGTHHTGQGAHLDRVWRPRPAHAQGIAPSPWPRRCRRPSS